MASKDGPHVEVQAPTTWNRVVDSTKFGKQLVALNKKNYLIAKRTWRATALRIFASFAFLLLVFLIDAALRVDSEGTTTYQTLRDPKAEAVDPIPHCADDRFISSESDCYDFGYTPAGNPVADLLATRMAENNPGRAIPVDRIKAFDDRMAADDWLLANPELIPAVVHFDFEPLDARYIGFTLQSNTTVQFFKGEFRDMNFYAQVPVQLATQREITRYLLEQAGSAPLESYDVFFSEFAHPAIKVLGFLTFLLGPFLFAANMFGFVLQLSQIVGERETGLRQSLTTAGMLDSAYWTSWALYELVMTFISSMLMGIFGYIFQFAMWKKNSFGLLFFLFFFFQLAMSGMGFCISSLIRKSSVAVYMGFFVFIVGWIFQVVVQFGFPYTEDYFFEGKPANNFGSFLFSALPFTWLTKGLQDLDNASANDERPGLEWSERYSYCKSGKLEPTEFVESKYFSEECVMPLGKIYEALFALYVLYMALGIYLDNILPNEHGQYRVPWFFLTPGFWNPGWQGNAKLHAHVDDAELNAATDSPDDEDVAAEKAAMKALLSSHAAGQNAMVDSAMGPQASGGSKSSSRNSDSRLGMVSDDNAVEVYGLKKVFSPWYSRFSKSAKSFAAIKGSWFSIKQDQLFCLLGPNGAGKTTTINALTGVSRPTGGDVLCAGYSLLSDGGVNAVRSLIGVCTQFDTLWGVLTGVEHLKIYAHIKGIPSNKVAAEAHRLLHDTALLYAATVQSGSYSGGMRRRLSVAIALLGDPAVVYLDEPTTGMDPIARRAVWDCIEAAKKGRAVVLTTHSMEEADVLGDRIAIMARGRLRCIASNLRLKQRFGAGYQVSVSVQPPREMALSPEALAQRAANVKALFKETLDIDAPADETSAYILFVVPRDAQAKLPALLGRLESEGESLGISDVHLGLTTLEEVFLNIARESEIEAAREHGGVRTSVKYTMPDGGQMDIPPGAETIMDPVTGQQYKVHWVVGAEGGLDIGQLEALEGDQVVPLHLFPAGEPVILTHKMPGGGLLRIPIGMPAVVDPSSGQPYDVQWATGPDGAATIVGMTPQAPAASPAVVADGGADGIQMSETAGQ